VESQARDVLQELEGRDGRASSAIFRKRRLLYGATTAAITLLLGVAVAGSVVGFDTYGVDTDEVRASGGGYQLGVEHATRSRGGLSTPLTIEVVRPDGFSGPITVAVDLRYLQMWDENALHPAPSGETVDGRWLVWELDPPAGDALTLSFDARIEPGVQSGRVGRVAVMEGGRPVVVVRFETRVLP
jgi:hypothetical protein